MKISCVNVKIASKSEHALTLSRFLIPSVNGGNLTSYFYF